MTDVDRLMLMFEDIIDRKLSGWVPPQVADHLEGIRNEMSALKEVIVASLAVNLQHQAECKAEVVALRILVGSQPGSLPVSSQDSSTTTLSAAAEGRPQPQPDTDPEADWWNQGEPIYPNEIIDAGSRWSPLLWPTSQHHTFTSSHSDTSSCQPFQEPALDQLSGMADQGWPQHQAWLLPSKPLPCAPQALAGRASDTSGWETNPVFLEQQLHLNGGAAGTIPKLPTLPSPSATFERTSDRAEANGVSRALHPVLPSSSSVFERVSPAMHRRHNPKSCMVCRGSFKKRSSCKEHMLKCLDVNARCQFLENCDTHMKYIRPFTGSTTEIRWASAVSEWIRRKE